MTSTTHTYEVRPRTDRPGVALISDVLPFGRVWYAEPNAVSNAIAYAMHYSRSNDAVIRVYDDAGNVIATHESFFEVRQCSPKPRLRSLAQPCPPSDT